MVEIIWTDNAISDLDDIGRYISKDSLKYAEMTVLKLFSAPNVLEKHPKKGNIVPEFMDETLRQLIVGNYRIVYRLDKETITILTVCHVRRLIKNVRQF